MWLFFILLSYFLFAASNFIDKYILGGALPSPKLYIFYMGLLSSAVLLIIPVAVLISLGILSPIAEISLFLPNLSHLFFIPHFSIILFSLFTGSVFLFAFYFYYKGVFEFEISRISPAIGGLIPIFTLILTSIIAYFPFKISSLQKGEIYFTHYLSFIFLVLGSIILSIHKEKISTLDSLKISSFSAFLFSLYFVSTKVVYFFLPFWPGFIWIRIGVLITALIFLFSSEVRKNVFNKKGIFKEKVVFPMILGKGFGGIGALLQNGAVYLAPLMFLPLINAMSGVQYVFLLIIATLLYFKFPKVLKEEISKKVFLQKMFAIFLIGIGLVFLAIK